MMELGIIALATKIGYVAVVGGASLLSISVLNYYHNFEAKSKTNSSKKGGDKYEGKSTSEKFKEIRKIHSAE